MSEDTKNMLKSVAGVLLFMFILYVLFSPSGFASTTFNFLQYAEPLTLQTTIAKAISVASYTPGDFTTTFDTSGKSHSIEFTKEDDIYYINIIPAQTSMLKTKFVGIEKIPIITKCTIETETFTLAEKATSLTMKKSKNPDGTCVVNLS